HQPIPNSRSPAYRPPITAPCLPPPAYWKGGGAMRLLTGPRSAVVVPTSAVGTRRRLNREKALVIVAFLLPPALIYFLLVLLPVIQAGYFSFFRWSGLGPIEQFIGLDNYARILRDRIF